MLKAYASCDYIRVRFLVHRGSEATGAQRGAHGAWGPTQESRKEGLAFVLWAVWAFDGAAGVQTLLRGGATMLCKCRNEGKG